MSRRIRRTISAWSTVPCDGTPFHTLGIVRFNPLASRFEGLTLADSEGKRHWIPLDFREEPTVWARLTPLEYEVPTSFAFTLTYECRRLTWRERFAEWLTALNLRLFYTPFARGDS